MILAFVVVLADEEEAADGIDNMKKGYRVLRFVCDNVSMQYEIYETRGKIVGADVGGEEETICLATRLGVIEMIRL